MGLAGLRRNKINSLIVRDSRLEDREDIINHINDFVMSLYAKEEWDRLSLNNLTFATLRRESAPWLEREFDEDEVRASIFCSSWG